MVAHSRDQGDARAARRLNEPRRAPVVALEGVPARIGGVPVAYVREEWRLSERWWTDQPVRRRYFDLVLGTGEHAVVFFDELGEQWYRQRA